MTTLTANDDASLAGPSWVRLAAKYGVPSVLCLWLVWWLTQAVSVDLRSLSAEQHTTQRAVEQHVSDMHADQEITRRLLYAICRNAAKSNDARELCEVGR